MMGSAKMQVGDTLDGRYEILSRGPRDQYVVKDKWSHQEREVTIQQEHRDHDQPVSRIMWFHDEVTFLLVREGRHHIVRMFGSQGEIIAAANSQEAVKAAWRLLMPGCPERQA